MYKELIKSKNNNKLSKNNLKISLKKYNKKQFNNKIIKNSYKMRLKSHKIFIKKMKESIIIYKITKIL